MDEAVESTSQVPEGTGSRLPSASEDTTLLTSGDVARLFGVDPKTVARWADAGKLDAMRTLGGHRRYRREDVESLLGVGDVAADPDRAVTVEAEARPAAG